MHKKTLIASLLLASAAHAQVNIDVDLNNKGIEVSPTLYGLFFEDINHAADGGLYAELVRNRSFEDSDAKADSWSAVGQSQISLTTEGLLNDKQGHALKLVTTKAGDGVQNTGFWGMKVTSGTQYKLSLWIKADKSYKGTLTATLVDAKGQPIGSTDMKVALKNKWQKVEASIIATGNDDKGELRLTTDQANTLYMDVVSLFPPTYKNRENGCRIDLAEMLAKTKPAFLRFPGGCFVEGERAPENAFRWERTVGPIEQRPGHYDANWRYRTSDGMGFHEFLQLSEDIGAKPLYVVNVGIWHGGYTPLDSVNTWIQECMDALEYANGDVTTKFGKMRAENGHPAPFNIEYLEIGNENANFHFTDNRDQSINYHERYKMFYDAVKAKYPNMKCIGNVEAWGTDNPSWRSDNPVELLDEHYYRNPSWFQKAYNKYDSYDRKGPKIYVGEYAVTSQFGKVGNLNAALGEAVYMMGMENNSDVVSMASYAPIFVNENAYNWPTDMIHFNSGMAFGTPSYWVQQLFPHSIGNRVINAKMEWSLPEPEAQKINTPIRVGMATWNTNATYKDPQLIVDGKAYALPALSDWKNGRRRNEWKVDGQEVTQTGAGQPAMFICPSEFTAESYTYRVKARKNHGAEGFLMVFNYQNERDFDWFNIGGWGNTQNNIEQGNGGGRVQLTNGKASHVNDNQWYDLQVDVKGDTITCYIDGKEEMRGVRMNPNMRGVYSNTTLDEKTNTLYIKVINVGEGNTTGTINLTNGIAKQATMERLSSENGTDENTLEHPLNIIPRPANVNIENGGQRITFPVAGYSINIIKVQL